MLRDVSLLLMLFVNVQKIINVIKPLIFPRVDISLKPFITARLMEQMSRSTVADEIARIVCFYLYIYFMKPTHTNEHRSLFSHRQPTIIFSDLINTLLTDCKEMPHLIYNLCELSLSH